MNIDLLRDILKKKNLYKDENSKNIIAICCFCNDHCDIHKKGHLWISKNPDRPIYHCFYCGRANSLRDIAFQLTGDNVITNQILSKEELSETLKKNSSATITNNIETKEVIIPQLDISKFPNKLKYIQKRTLIDNVDYNNLIFDIEELISLNPYLCILSKESPDFVKYLQDSFVCFIGYKQTVLFFRCIDPNSKIKFFKYSIQPSKFDLLEYIKFDGENKDSNLIVMAEGVFNNIAVMKHNVLNLSKEALMFVSGQSFSYDSLLKSVCFDHNLYKVNVVILSDMDKPKYSYFKFIKKSQHIIKSIRTYYNKDKKDFGTFPISPILVN